MRKVKELDLGYEAGSGELYAIYTIFFKDSPLCLKGQDDRIKKYLLSLNGKPWIAHYWKKAYCASKGAKWSYVSWSIIGNIQHRLMLFDVDPNILGGPRSVIAEAQRRGRKVSVLYDFQDNKVVASFRKMPNKYLKDFDGYLSR